MRVMEAATAIGENLGLSPERLQMLRRAALLHDVGKLGISNTILDKPGSLTSTEFEAVKTHPENGYQILKRISSFEEIALLAREHHERLDGSGYPSHHQAKHLSLESRILSTADVYGALSEKRPYRDALSPSQVASIMIKDVPFRADPRCFEALDILLSDHTWYLNEPTTELRESCALPSSYFQEEIYI